jgi:hypothetical protein
MSIVQELADECIREDCGYDPLEQHVVCWMREKRDDVIIQDWLADHLANVVIEGAGTKYSLWQILAPDAMRTDDLSAEAMVDAIRREAKAWATIMLSREVDAEIDRKMASFIPTDGTEFVDEFGGFQ